MYHLAFSPTNTEERPIMYQRMASEGAMCLLNWTDDQVALWRDEMHSAVVVAADNAANLFYSRWEKKIIKEEYLERSSMYEDVRKIRQPFRKMWVEWRLPIDENIRIGVLGVDEPNGATKKTPKGDGTGGMLRLLFGRAHDAKPIYIGEGAKVVPYNDKGEQTPAQHRVMVPPYIEKTTEEQQKSWESGIVGATAIYLSVISFLNCRNVTTQASKFTDRQQKHLCSRFGNRNRYEFHTIKVNGQSIPPRAVNGRSHQNAAAEHMAAGHFKTYSAERPLFGRISGTIWWDPQLRGRRANGRIDKQYIADPTSSAKNYPN